MQMYDVIVDTSIDSRLPVKCSCTCKSEQRTGTPSVILLEVWKSAPADDGYVAR